MNKYENIECPDEFNTVQELKILKDLMDNVSEDDLQFAMNAEVDEEEMYRKFLKRNHP